MPNWNDISPCLGAAYDVFGNGRTAVKGSFGKYMGSAVVSIGQALAPANRLATSATRTWSDANGNYFPDCSLADPNANGECGRLSNVNLGLPVPATTWDPSLITGHGKRPYNWQSSVNLQQELVKGMALNVGYFRAWYGNLTVTANRAYTPANFDQYCVTAPTDSRLGSASGQQVCGLYDVTPALFGRVDNLVSLASTFGKLKQQFDGIDAAVNARFGKGGVFQGGVSTGRTVNDNCSVVQGNPQIPLTIGVAGVPTSGTATAGRADTTFCHVVLPWKAQTQYKVAANYPLPFYGLQLSGTLQNLPGIPLQAFYVAGNAQIAPSLGRNLAAGAAAVQTIALMKPNTRFEGRITQFDMRLTKTQRVGRYKLQGQFDIYNAFNASPVLGEVYTYGANWLRPSSILGGRLLKFGAQLDF